ncbi:MAG: ATP-binding protein [Chitinivibrionales bacterium]
MKKLPIGIQTFRDIIEENCYYVDKTEAAFKLADRGRYYFLSRPRRFGKSLFLDTLAEMFECNKSLFEGLWVYDKWDWEDPHPVIRISFGSGDFSGRDKIKNKILFLIKNNTKQLSLDYVIDDTLDFNGNFISMIQSVYEKYGKKVVILIDEYDKPILDNITDRDTALDGREILRTFYSAIKDCDRYIRFVFITGVSKFSKMNLFSGLNNLEDITIKKDYAEITGYTHADILRVFKERLEGVDLEMVKRWYNGYNYLGEDIYNPFDILLFLSNDCVFKNYWWGTGNPGFLIEKLKTEDYYLPDLENISVGEETLNTFDIDKIDLTALLWQTGYLTFDKRIFLGGRVRYKMKIPNLEIMSSLNSLFFDYLTNLNGSKESKEIALTEALLESDFSKSRDILKSFFASIPYTNYANNIISGYEGYYASVVFTLLASQGFEVIAEDTTNRGRIDMTLKFPESIVIIEFKVDIKESPINQIKERKYYEKYASDTRDIYLVGMCFDSNERNISEFIWEKL